MLIMQKKKPGWLLQESSPLHGGGDITERREPLRTGGDITETRPQTPIKPSPSHQRLIEEIYDALMAGNLFPISQK